MLSMTYATLNDRTRILIRPVQPGDADMIDDMHQRLSSNSLYQRYMQYAAPPAAEFEHLYHLPPEAGAAFVAIAESPGEKVVGMAYYLLETPQVAEPALLVEDQYQGRGLGKFLFWHLCQHARQQKIMAFDALVYSANEPVMHILRRSGFPFTQSFAYGMREIRIALAEAQPEMT